MGQERIYIVSWEAWKKSHRFALKYCATVNATKIGKHRRGGLLLSIRWKGLISGEVEVTLTLDVATTCVKSPSGEEFPIYEYRDYKKLFRKLRKLEKEKKS
jgi:hypothetical protein